MYLRVVGQKENVTIGLDDFTFVLPFACDYFASVLPPFVADDFGYELPGQRQKRVS